jgi:hypothetical protein
MISALKKAAAYSPTSYGSTIGADGLNFPVRYGKGWAPSPWPPGFFVVSLLSNVSWRRFYPRKEQYLNIKRQGVYSGKTVLIVRQVQGYLLMQGV